MNKQADIRIYPNLAALEDAVAKHFLLATNQAVQQRGQALIALSGGSTPLGLFHLLGSDAYRATLPWTQMHFFWVDERLVPPQDQESNFGQFKNNVLDPLRIAPQQVHAIDGNIPALEAVQSYEEVLHTFAEAGQELPRFDWVLLGMGTDGHTASLFPGQWDLEMAEKSVMAVTADYDGRPSGRVTLTPRILNLARQVVFMVSGAAKAQRLQEVLQGERDPLRLPAQHIQPVDGRLVWMLDEAAASRL
ncbi:MAG: 6-phosphogluconolactonase [Anaerolineaceae bacterium]|jgi:6-phosphogluconolactonase|nr:6-phosphogluconolactonase [Anaerolineaceae bacterium]